MHWAKAAALLQSAWLCRASSESSRQDATQSQVLEVGSKATLMRADKEYASVRPHIGSDKEPAALTEAYGSEVADKEAREKVLSLARKAAAQQKEHDHTVAMRMNQSMAGANVDLGWKPCDWQTPTTDETMHCVDGSYCTPTVDQWTCCATHGGRLQCPKAFPKMCNQKDCGGNDYCCATWCEYYDGDKPCNIKQKVYAMDAGWLTFLTRDADGDPIAEWTDLVSGPMTWEVWYARRPQGASSSPDGNAIMATYADNHNTDAYTTHNRRRNIGVYIQPDGRVSISTFIGDNVKEAPEPNDPFSGAHAILGPTIKDYNWHHIAAVWDKTAGKGWLYIDGVPHDQPVRYEPGDENPGLEGKLVIGGGHLGRTSVAQVSQFRIWKLAMHVPDLMRIMACGEPDLPVTDLKAFYRLSGNMQNSAKSGFLPLSWEKTQGVFTEADPCLAGAPGLKGKDSFGGPPGPIGDQGDMGMKGLASDVVGERGPRGPPGPKGPRGKPPIAVGDNLSGATMADVYQCIGICLGLTVVVGCLSYLQFIREKKGAKKADAGESWEGGEEAWK